MLGVKDFFTLGGSPLQFIARGLHPTDEGDESKSIRGPPLGPWSDAQLHPNQLYPKTSQHFQDNEHLMPFNFQQFIFFFLTGQ